MEWTKIKTKHFLFTDYNLSQIGCFTTILCLTAHLERLPSKKEMIKATHYRSLISLQRRLKEQSIDLQEVLNKVLEDVQWIEHKKEISRGTSNRYNKKKKKIDASNDTTEKRREEKRREEREKNITHPPLVSISKEEQKQLLEKYEKSSLRIYVEQLNDYGATFPDKFKKYKSHAAVLRSWMRKDNVRPKGAR